MSVSNNLSYEDIIILKHNSTLDPDETRRVTKLLYPSQDTSAEIKMELNKLTRQTFSAVINKLGPITKNNHIKQNELIQETIKACMMQHLYTSIYAEIIAKLCDDDLDSTIIDCVFKSLIDNEENVKALKGISIFFLTWTRLKKISFGDFSSNISKLATLSQIVFLSTVFNADTLLFKTCADLASKLLSFIDDPSIPFQYKVDLLTLKDILEKDNE